MTTEQTNWMHVFDTVPAFLAFWHKEHGDQVFKELMDELVAAKASSGDELGLDALTLLDTGLEDLGKLVLNYSEKAPADLLCPNWWPCHNREPWCCSDRKAPGAPWNKDKKRKPRREHSNPLVQEAVRAIAERRVRDRCGGRFDRLSEASILSLIEQCKAGGLHEDAEVFKKAYGL